MSFRGDSRLSKVCLSRDRGCFYVNSSGLAQGLKQTPANSKAHKLDRDCDSLGGSSPGLRPQHFLRFLILSIDTY